MVAFSVHSLPFGIHFKVECFKCSQLISHNMSYNMDHHRCFYRSSPQLHTVRYTVIEKLAPFETFNLPMDPERKTTIEATIIYGRSLSNPFVPCLILRETEVANNIFFNIFNFYIYNFVSQGDGSGTYLVFSGRNSSIIPSEFFQQMVQAKY